MSWIDEIRVVIGLGKVVTITGFSLHHVNNDDVGAVQVNSIWPGDMGTLKTNTVLQYNANFEDVESWGYPALYKKPNEKNKDNEMKPVELFKLYLGNCLEKSKPKLPIDFEKAITDYLREMGKWIKETIPQYWPGINFMENVLLVFTIPAEYSETDKAIMRKCTFNAGLISELNSERLQFTTEPEAAAIYCMNFLKEHKLTEPGATFMTVDCGGGTVDLTTRKLLEENQLSEVTERAGDFCGSTFIDKEFINLLKREVGSSAVDLLSDKHYGQLQYLVQEFCQYVKIPFTGNDPNFNYYMNLEEIAPALLQYVTGSEKDLMKNKEWLMKIDFNTIKPMFDPIVDRIIEMIRVQLKNSSGKCSAIFLVGGFGQSEYLQKRIKKEFSQSVKNISIPNQPIAAVVRGAAIYGKSLVESKNYRNANNLKCVIATRVLNHTFGTTDRITFFGKIHKFRRIIERKTEVTVDQEFVFKDLYPVQQFQTKMKFEIYYTKAQDAVYCDEPGMKLLGSLLIELPDVHLGFDRLCTFSISFGYMEIKARAFNQTNGQNYETRFELNNY